MKRFSSLNLPENQRHNFGKLEKIFPIAAALSFFILMGLFIYALYNQKKNSREQEERYITIEKELDILGVSLEDAKILILASLDEQNNYIKTENEIIREQQKNTMDYLRYIINPKLDRVIGNIHDTDKHIGQIEEVYGALLDEQKKQTLENLYNEEAILDHLEKAKTYFKEEKYGYAYSEYVIVAGEQIDNLEVQFFKYYCLFLRNREDQNQYRSIKNGLAGLRQRGYDREEISEVLEYIAAEEGFSNYSL